MKKIYFLIGALVLSGSTMAQISNGVKTYDFVQSGKHIPGAISVKDNRNVNTNQDRTVYFTEDFNGGLNGWVADNQAGPADFGLTTTGHQNTASNSFQIPALSTTGNWVLFDSDGDGTGYTTPEEATFNSPKIDLTSATGVDVALKFDQFFAEWDVNFSNGAESSEHMYIAISTDSSDWSNEIEINEGVGRLARENPEQISWDITDYIAGNEANIWFRFRWEGAWNYGWQFDNIIVEDILNKDLGVKTIWRGMSDLSPANGSSLYMYSQIPQAHVDTMIVGAIVENLGHLTHTNVVIDYEITGPLGTVVNSGQVGFADPIVNEPGFDTLLFSTDYVPDALGNYSLKMTVSSTEGDDLVDNDSLVDAFYEVTDFTYAADFAEGSAVGCDAWPLSGNTEGWYGNVFLFKGSDQISGIDFKVANNASNVGEIVYGEIYSFDTGTSEWVSQWDNNSTGHPIVSGDLGNIVTMSTDGFSVNEITEFYLVTVKQLAPTTDPIFERQGDVKLGRTQGYSFSSTNSEYGGISFFDRLAPIVRARVNSAEVGIDDTQMDEKFSVYPNPASDVVNVNVTLTNSENTTIKVLDISGKVIQTINLGTVNGEQKVAVSVADFSTGVYFIEMTNTNGKQVKKFVKK